jgi:hypothetical protein
MYLFPQEKKKHTVHIRDFKRGVKRSTPLAIKQTDNVVASSDRAQGEMERKGMLIVFNEGKKGGD